jgi:hypothetical protein
MSLLSVFRNTVTGVKGQIKEIFYDLSSKTLSTPNISIEPIDASTNGELRFKELAANGSDYIGLKAPVNLVSTTVFELPAIDGTPGQILTTNGSKKLSFTDKATAFGSGRDDYTSTGQTDFVYLDGLANKIEVVLHEGIQRRLGYDYTVLNNTVSFNYLIPAGHWVTIFGLPNAMDRMDITSSGQTQFTASADLTGKNVLVTHNGIAKRIGGGYDYTISGSVVTFNFTIPAGDWVSIVLLG